MTRKRKIERNTDSQIGYTEVREREGEWLRQLFVLRGSTRSRKSVWP